MIVVGQGCLGGHHGRGIDVERLAHPVQHIGNLRVADAIADTQAGQAMNLGEGARYHQVRVFLQTFNPIRVVTFLHVFEVGLVQHHDHPLRNARQELIQGMGIEPGASGVVRVGHENHPGALGHRLSHGRQVVAIEIGRHRHRPGIASQGH